MDKRGLKRKVVIVQLRVLGMLGMHEKKAQVLRNSGLFKKYGSSVENSTLRSYHSKKNR
jgi:hypothetical protein